jgi:hypothetical protein
MFWPYLAFLRQLFPYWNSYTALVLKLKYSNVIHFCRSLIGIHLLESITLNLFLHYSLLVTCVFFIVLFSPVNICVLLSLLFLYVPLICMFSCNWSSRVYVTLLKRKYSCDLTAWIRSSCKLSSCAMGWYMCCRLMTSPRCFLTLIKRMGIVLKQFLHLSRKLI